MVLGIFLPLLFQQRARLVPLAALEEVAKSVAEVASSHEFNSPAPAAGGLVFAAVACAASPPFPAPRPAAFAPDPAHAWRGWIGEHSYGVLRSSRHGRAKLGAL